MFAVAAQHDKRMALRIKLENHLCHRAQRFQLRLPLTFRIIGAEWQTATTVNVSRTGVLFEAAMVEAPGTFLECRISLTPEIGAEGVAHFWGPVVRVNGVGNIFQTAVSATNCDIDR